MEMIAFEEGCAAWTSLVRDQWLCCQTVMYLHLKPGLLIFWREHPNWPLHFYQTWFYFQQCVECKIK